MWRESSCLWQCAASHGARNMTPTTCTSGTPAPITRLRSTAAMATRTTTSSTSSETLQELHGENRSQGLSGSQRSTRITTTAYVARSMALQRTSTTPASTAELWAARFLTLRFKLSGTSLTVSTSFLPKNLSPTPQLGDATLTARSMTYTQTPLRAYAS